MSKSAAAGTPATIAAMRGSPSLRARSSAPKRWRMTVSAEPLARVVERAAGQLRGQADARLEVLGEVGFAMAREARRRPAAAGEAEGGVAARRHAVDADLVESKVRREARVAAHRVDRAHDLARPDLPAVRVRAERRRRSCRRDGALRRRRSRRPRARGPGRRASQAPPPEPCEMTTSLPLPRRARRRRRASA